MSTNSDSAMEKTVNASTALVLGGAAGLLGVAAGAFGAHALRGHVDARDLEIWRTATAYQQLHAVVLVAVGLLGARQWSRYLRAATIALSLGIVVFAGTLEAMVLGGPRWLGAITPIGGLALMVGWGCVLAHGIAASRRSV